MYLFKDEIEETKWSHEEYISFFKKRVCDASDITQRSISSAGFGAEYMGLIPTLWFKYLVVSVSPFIHGL